MYIIIIVNISPFFHLAIYAPGPKIKFTFLYALVQETWIYLFISGCKMNLSVIGVADMHPLPLCLAGQLMKKRLIGFLDTQAFGGAPNQEEDQVKGQGHPRKGQERGGVGHKTKMRTKSKDKAPNQEEDQVKGQDTKPRGRPSQEAGAPNPRRGPSKGIGHQTKKRTKSRGRGTQEKDKEGVGH
jgi:hypothetical protein